MPPEETKVTMAETRPDPSPNAAPNPPPDPVSDPEDAARRKRLRGFLNHLIAYFAVMVVLVPINAVLDPGRAWFVLPLVGWGAPLAVHAAHVMGLIGRKRRGEGA